MPYVSEAWNLPLIRLDDAAAAAADSLDGRIALIGSPQVRCVMLVWEPGFTTSTHRHPHALEAFLVLEGELMAWLEGPSGVQEFRAPQGSLMLSQPGMGHRFRVEGDRPVRLLAIVAPNEDRPDETID